ncbi:MAG TPA: amidohydrolase family protein [Vicinamibacterales bacterium]|nr:amidohydrolase family protein [Vicinamibacterales bacterium]
MNDGRGISRRDLFTTAAAAGVGIALGGDAAIDAQAPAPSAPPAEDLVFVNGRIHTMDAKDTVVTTVTIRNGRFAVVGGATPRPAQGQRVIDLGGRTVTPGILDNHNHIVLMGNRPGYHTPLEHAASIRDLQETLAARAKEVPAGAWITTIGGFHRNQLVPPGEMPRLPTLAELDQAVGTHPVYLSEGFNGPSVTNSAGKKMFERQNPPIPVGEDGAIAANAMATGRATLFLRQTLLNAEQRKRGALDAMKYGLSLGVTTHLDQGAFQAANMPSDGAAHEDNYSMHQPFLALHAEGLLPARLRINFLHQDATPELLTLTERLKQSYPFFGDDVVRTGGIGEFIAGGFGPNAPLVQAAQLVARAGWRAETHSLSQTDFQQEIQAYEAAHAETPIAGLRWVVAHVPFITEPWVNRLKAIGGGLSLTSWRYLAGTPQQNGPDFKMILANGIHCGMSSDGMQIAPMNPWLHMYYATTGLNARQALINGGKQITRQDVLRLYTASNGWFFREEDRLGSIETGKLADLVVLNQDYFTARDEDLKKIRSVMTVVGGRIAHDAGAIASKRADANAGAAAARA